MNKIKKFVSKNWMWLILIALILITVCVWAWVAHDGSLKEWGAKSIYEMTLGDLLAIVVAYQVLGHYGKKNK